jgi:uncharacterized protein with GYD domain
MPTYVSLLKYTAKGIAEVKTSPDRIAAARAAAESVGGSMGEFLVTMGRYDGVVTSEFPDDETAAAFMLRIGTLGFVSTETLRAFDESSFKAITDKL